MGERLAAEAAAKAEQERNAAEVAAKAETSDPFTMSSKSLTIKATIDGDTRRILLNLDPSSAAASFAAITSALSTSFDLQPSQLPTLKYKDEDDDLCTLAESTIPDFLSLSESKPGAPVKLHGETAGVGSAAALGPAPPSPATTEAGLNGKYITCTTGDASMRIVESGSVRTSGDTITFKASTGAIHTLTRSGDALTGAVTGTVRSDGKTVDWSHGDTSAVFGAVGVGGFSQLAGQWLPHRVEEWKNPDSGYDRRSMEQWESSLDSFALGTWQTERLQGTWKAERLNDGTFLITFLSGSLMGREAVRKTLPDGTAFWPESGEYWKRVTQD